MDRESNARSDEDLQFREAPYFLGFPLPLSPGEEWDSVLLYGAYILPSSTQLVSLILNVDVQRAMGRSERQNTIRESGIREASHLLEATRDVEDLPVLQAIQEGLSGDVDAVVGIAQQNLSSVSPLAKTCLQILQWRYTKVVPSTSEFASAAEMARPDKRSRLLLVQYQAVSLLLKEERSLALSCLQELSTELDSDEPLLQLFARLAMQHAATTQETCPLL